MNITVLFNPSQRQIFSYESSFLGILQPPSQSLPFSQCHFSIAVKLIKVSSNHPLFAVHLLLRFLPVSPASCFTSTSFEAPAGRSSLPQPLPLRGIVLPAWLPQQGHSHRRAQQPPDVAPAWHGARALLLPGRGFFPRLAAAKNAVEEIRSSLG